MDVFIMAFGIGVVAGWLLCKIESDFSQQERDRARRAHLVAVKARIDEALLPGPWTSAEGR